MFSCSWPTISGPVRTEWLRSSFKARDVATVYSWLNVCKICNLMHHLPFHVTHGQDLGTKSFFQLCFKRSLASIYQYSSTLSGVPRYLEICFNKWKVLLKEALLLSRVSRVICSRFTLEQSVKARLASADGWLYIAPKSNALMHAQTFSCCQ